MAFNGNFSISQGIDPTSFIVTDVSTGSDTNLTDRQIRPYKSDGTILLPSGNTLGYIDWPLSAGSTITISGLLNVDYSLDFQITWVSSSPLPPPSTYISSQLYTFEGNLSVFVLGLTQIQAGNPLLVSDNNYFPNRMKLRVFMDDAINCTIYNDQYNAQLSLNDAYKMQQNQNAYF